MRIGLNLLHARLEIGGAWNYIENIVDLLRSYDGDFECIAYCTEASAGLVPHDPRFRKRLTRLGSANQVTRILYEQTILPFVAHRDRVDCLYWFANNGPILLLTPSVVTIHDMMFLDEHARDFASVSPLKRLYLRAMASYTCSHAEVLAPVSETTGAIASRLFKADPARMVVIANPLNPDFHRRSRQDVAEFLQRFGLPPHFWLYVAHPYPHKNHLNLLQAFKMFGEATHCVWPLVLRGDREKGASSIDDAIAQLGLASSVIWIPRLSAKDMSILYSAASALVFPSLYEGGGIPVLEAMACECPVVASDIPTSKEFAGDAALFCNATSAHEISTAMVQLYSDSALRDSLAAEGLKQASLFTRERVRERLFAAFSLGTGKTFERATGQAKQNQLA